MDYGKKRKKKTKRFGGRVSATSMEIVQNNTMHISKTREKFSTICERKMVNERRTLTNAFCATIFCFRGAMARAPFLGARGWDLLHFKHLKSVDFFWLKGERWRRMRRRRRETNRLDDDRVLARGLRGAFWAMGGGLWGGGFLVDWEGIGRGLGGLLGRMIVGEDDC